MTGCRCRVEGGYLNLTTRVVHQEIIVFCPLHKAAEEMLAFLLREQENGPDDYEHKTTVGDRDALIARAEGRGT